MFDQCLNQKIKITTNKQKKSKLTAYQDMKLKSISSIANSVEAKTNVSMQNASDLQTSNHCTTIDEQVKILTNNILMKISQVPTREALVKIEPNQNEKFQNAKKPKQLKFEDLNEQVPIKNDACDKKIIVVKRKDESSSKKSMKQIKPNMKFKFNKNNQTSYVKVQFELSQI